MNKELLRKIGLTEGEIRVYAALIKLGKSSTGKIMEESGISSSKVYLILDRLIRKGFVACVFENNVKVFHVANPINILEYIKEKQRELEGTREEAGEFIKDLTRKIGRQEIEFAQVYRGVAGMRGAFQNILDELEKNESFLFFGMPEFKAKDVITFFRNLHAKRMEKGIIAKGIVDKSCEEIFKKGFAKSKNVELKFIDLSIPHALAIGKKRIILTLWEENPIAFEIFSERLANKYRSFFFKIWNKSEK